MDTKTADIGSRLCQDSHHHICDECIIRQIGNGKTPACPIDKSAINMDTNVLLYR